jgi:hypothetical protein
MKQLYPNMHHSSGFNGAGSSMRAVNQNNYVGG